MEIIFLIPEYFLWHYTAALRSTLNIATNFLWFTYHFFSMPILWQTLFAPWQVSRAKERIYATKPNRGFEIVKEASLQIFGAVIRMFTLVFGVTMCVGVGLAGVVMLVIWFCLPLIVAALIFGGLRFLFL